MTPALFEVLKNLRSTVSDMKRTIARYEAGEVLIYEGGRDASGALVEALRALVSDHEETVSKFDPEGLTA